MTGSTTNSFLRPLYASTAIIIAVAAQPAQAEVRTFDIPAQPAKTAIAVFAKQSGLQILADENIVRGKSANAVTGPLEVDTALDQLLAGTGLVAIRPTDAGGIIVIKLAKSMVAERTAVPVALREGGADSAASDDIIVTARRQSETSLATPVILTGISQKEIERRHLTRIDELNNVVPQLQIGQGASIQGGSIVLRGIGANANTTTADQGVTFNIDGAQVARSSIRRIGQMDMEQIEVLKGPQALFFGKNSPGGVISIRTADPTPDFQAKASVLYEFVGREIQADGFAAGPLTDSLGIRLAGRISHSSGWEKNITPSSTPFGSPEDRLPHDREVALRLTLKFDPSDSFDARFKLNYGRVKTPGSSEIRQYVYCPLGIPQIPLGQNGLGEDCKADNKISFTGYGPNFASLGVGDGNPVTDQTQWLSSLEMNFRPSSSLTITSLSSYYKAKIDWVDTYFTTTDPNFVFVGDYHPQIRELSQELRLASDFKGPVNFLIGTYLQDSEFLYRTQDAGFANNPISFGRNFLNLDGSHASIFGQLRFNPIESLEISGGGRYSWERKHARRTNLVTGVLAADNKNKWTNFSPEVTAAWRPSQRLTVFASYKKGFLSGGFAPSAGTYDQQITKGGEAGVKFLTLDDSLRVNVSAYHYVSTGLQVTVVEGIQFVTRNAGKATVKGIEADFNWQGGVEGLSLRGAIGYNKAQYDVYTTNCYPGQTIAMGCNLAPGTSGAFTLQNLSGRQLSNAPSVSGNLGVNYEAAVSGDWRLELSGDASFTSSYFTETNLAPTSRQGGYWLFDANLRLKNENSGWEFALLGRNLTNKYVFHNSFSVLFTGGPSGTNGPSAPADRYAYINPGRQVSLQATYRFGGK